MKKKNQNILLLVGAGVLVWWLLRKKKMQKAATPGGAAIPPRMQNAVIEAQSDARDMANSIISQTTFVPDFTTDADRYKADKNACR